MKPTDGVAGEALQGDARSHQSRPTTPCRIAGATTSITRAPCEGKQYPIYCRKKRQADCAGRSRARPERAGQGPEVHGARRVRAERRRQPAGVLDRQHRLSPVHAAGQGSAHRRRCFRNASSASTESSPGPPTTRRSSMSLKTRSPSAATSFSATCSGTQTSRPGLRREGRAVRHRRQPLARQGRDLAGERSARRRPSALSPGGRSRLRRSK